MNDYAFDKQDNNYKEHLEYYKQQKNLESIYELSKDDFKMMIIGNTCKLLVEPSMQRYADRIIELARKNKKAMNERIFDKTVRYVSSLNGLAKISKFNNIYASLLFFVNEIEAITNIDVLKQRDDLKEVKELLVKATENITNNGVSVSGVKLKYKDIEQIFDAYYEDMSYKESLFVDALSSFSFFMYDATLVKKFVIFGKSYKTKLKDESSYDAEVESFSLDLYKLMSSSVVDRNNLIHDSFSSLMMMAFTFGLYFQFDKWQDNYAYRKRIINVVWRSGFFMMYYPYLFEKILRKENDSKVFELPQYMRKVRSLNDVLDRTQEPSVLGEDGKSVVDHFLSLLVLIGVEPSYITLDKVDQKRILGFMCSLKEMYENFFNYNYTEEDIERSLSILYPFVIAICTMGLEYKKVFSMISSEMRKVNTFEVDETSRLKEELKQVSSELVSSKSSLDSATQFAIQRLDKIGRLEKQISDLKEKVKNLEDGKKLFNTEMAAMADKIVDLETVLEENGIKYEDGEEIEETLQQEDVENIENGVSEIDETTGKNYSELLREASKDVSIILAGCTMPIIKKMGTLQPRIRCTFGNETQTLEGTFRSADIVMIRYTSMGHKQFQKIKSVTNRVYYLGKSNNVSAIEKDIYMALCDLGLVKQRDKKDSERE